MFFVFFPVFYDDRYIRRDQTMAGPTPSDVLSDFKGSASHKFSSDSSRPTNWKT